MSNVKTAYYHLDLSGNGLFNTGFEVVNSLPVDTLFDGRQVTLATDGSSYKYFNGAWHRYSTFDPTTTSIASVLGGFFAGPIPINIVIAKQYFRTDTVFAANVPGSVATAEVAPEAAVEFDIRYISPVDPEVSVGKIQFGTGSVLGSFNVANAFTVVTGGYLKLVAPDTTTSNLAGFYFDMLGSGKIVTGA